ncbi:MAG: hypothetical protein ACKOWE_02545 [Micrococcales bacterium]
MQGFVDETKAKKYRMVLVVIANSQINKVRRELNKLKNPSGRPVHFQTDDDSVRNIFISKLFELDFEAYAITTEDKNPRNARKACLGEICLLVESLKLKRLVLELDESIKQWDLRTLKEFLSDKAIYHQISYLHLRDSEEICLTIADALAWCLNRGGDWHKKVQNLITKSIVCS